MTFTVTVCSKNSNFEQKLTLFITLESYEKERSYLVCILYRWSFSIDHVDTNWPRWWPCDLNRDLCSKNSHFKIVATGASVSHKHILLWISCVHMLKKWRNLMKSLYMLYFTTFVLECTIFYCDIINCMHVHYTSNFSLPSRDMTEIQLKRRKSSIQPSNQPTKQPTNYF